MSTKKRTYRTGALVAAESTTHNLSEMELEKYLFTIEHGFPCRYHYDPRYDETTVPSEITYQLQTFKVIDNSGKAKISGKSSRPAIKSDKPTLWAPTRVLYQGVDSADGEPGAGIGVSNYFVLDSVTLNFKPRPVDGYGIEYVDFGMPISMYKAVVDKVESDTSEDCELHPLTPCEDEQMMWTSAGMLGAVGDKTPNTSLPPYLINVGENDTFTYDPDLGWNRSIKSCTDAIRNLSGFYTGIVLVQAVFSTPLNPGEDYTKIAGFIHTLKFKLAGMRILGKNSQVHGPVISKNVAPEVGSVI